MADGSSNNSPESAAPSSPGAPVSAKSPRASISTEREVLKQNLEDVLKRQDKEQPWKRSTFPRTKISNREMELNRSPSPDLPEPRLDSPKDSGCYSTETLIEPVEEETLLLS